MIGFYNYTVILTYMAVMSAVVGITQLFNGRLLWAIVCLMLAGCCDMFDGKVARMKKDRTEREKVFGIQIDSLSDVICFGVFPAMFNYEVAVLAKVSLPIEIFSIFVSAYQGLPVTSIAMILPVAYIAKKYVEKAFDKTVYSIGLSVLLLIIGFLFVYDFKIKKPNNREVGFIIVCAIIVIAGCILL